MTTKADARSADLATTQILHEGATEAQIALLFAAHQNLVKRAILKVKPCGTRLGRNIYKVSEVAPYVVRPDVTPEMIKEFVEQSDIHALPPIFRKEYWAGMRMKQDFDIKAGDLWSTKKVVESVGKLVKLINLATRLMIDSVEREVELTPAQRKIIKRTSDGMLNDLQRLVREGFDKPEGEETEQLSDRQMVVNATRGASDDEF